MTDISQGPGFEIPSYDDMVNQFGQSGNDKLEKVAQVLMTAQIAHGVLSNFKGYKEIVDKASTEVFDPIKNQMVKGVETVNKLGGKIPGASGDISADVLQTIKNPGQAKQLVKNTLARGKKAVEDEFSNIKGKASKVVDDLKEGNMPEFNMSDESSTLMKTASSFAKKADISDRIVKDFQDVVQQRYDNIPADMKKQLLDLGVGENELKQVVSGAAPKDLEKLAWEKMGRAARYDNPFESPELDIPEEYLGKVYRAKKFLSKLSVPQEEGGMGMGDSTIARLGKTAKETYNTAKSEAKATMDEFEQTPAKIGKRLKVKQQSRARKQFEQEQEQMNKEPEFPEIKPAPGKTSIQQEFEDIPEINMTNQASADATKTLTNGDIVTADESLSDTSSALSKAKSALTKITENDEELDVTPIGDLINGGLALATFGTMIAGLFENKPKPQVVGTAEQLGV
jgi:hypothetical protein